VRRSWLLLLAACGGDLDPPWQLDHDRIVAVRATPPAIPAGGKSTLDGLIAVAGQPTMATMEKPPELAAVVSPQSLASTLAQDGGNWVVTAPDDATLAAAREELGIPAGAPVPLLVGVSYGNMTLAATKVVLLGVAGDNPTLADVTIDGAAPPDMLSVGVQVDVPLSVTAVETDDVNWLTSCGTMHDFDLPQAYLRVEPEDPMAGEIAVVLRDDHGGVTWRVWPIEAH
jgi:hypothetical protein